METVQERIKQAQTRIRLLNSNRETLIGDARVEEQKIKQAYKELEGLGVSNPSSLSVEELTDMGEKAKQKLETLLDSLEKQISKGEKLVQEYHNLQEG